MEALLTRVRGAMSAPREGSSAGTGLRSRVRAMRHPASGFHSFRSVVSDTWVLRGPTWFTLSVNTLRPPCAISFGVVTMAADVNDDVGWAAGAPGFWGFIQEGTGTFSRQHRALSPGQMRALLTGDGSAPMVKVDGVSMPLLTVNDQADILPELSKGSTVHICIDATIGVLTLIVGNCTLEMPLPPVPLKISAESGPCSPVSRATADADVEEADNAESGSPERPELFPGAPKRFLPLESLHGYSLAVGLKYASDEVEIQRITRGAGC